MLEKRILPLFDNGNNSPPCQDCPSSCCAPVKMNLEEFYPLGVDDSRQINKNFQLIDAVRMRIMEYIKEFERLGRPKSIDDRFSLRGYYILEKPGNSICRLTTPEGEALNAWNIDVCFLYDCAAYDKTQGLCTRYNTRPSMCINYSSDHCGMDSLSRAIYSMDTREGRLRDATVRFHDKILAESEPSIEEAFEVFLAHKGEVPLFV